MALSRRDFLKIAGLTGAAASTLPAWWPEWIDPAYAAPRDLAKRKKRGSARRSLLNFVHFTDIHIVDAESPARVEFLDRYDDKQCSDAPFTSAYRPQEALTVQVLESMIRQVRAIR